MVFQAVCCIAYTYKQVRAIFRQKFQERAPYGSEEYRIFDVSSHFQKRIVCSCNKLFRVRGASPFPHHFLMILKEVEDSYQLYHADNSLKFPDD